MIPTPTTGIHKEQIKYLIRRCGWNLTDLSVHWGFQRSAISKTLNTPWPEIESRIAQFLGQPPMTIWPDRYDQDGIPLKGNPTKRNDTRQMLPHNDHFDGAL